MTPKIEGLLADLEASEKALRKEIENAYPVGCEVEYRIRDGVPSRIGTVLAIVGGFDGKVKLRYAPNEQNLPVRKIIGRVKTNRPRGKADQK